ncbi:sensor histidine kinase [Halorubrum rubrum]|uniref:histidine kinase n=1 Tax=Halorubrum rubrum TaxID=1126240 RepID=A0ABD5R0N4_9EURY|nr:HAMP domain-containing sensor histidine kinase [Halorubrum rubrum]
MSDPSVLRVSLASHPAPVLTYEMRDDVPTVMATNDAFDATIGVDPGEPISALFERFDTVKSSNEETLKEQLRAGEAVELFLKTTDASQYVAHVLAPDTDGGTIVFVDHDVAVPFTDDVDVGQVASVISHDLRNPLDVAGAHLEAARETGADEHFDAIDAAHDRMERIIQDVLTLARGEAALNPEHGVSVREMAERAWQTVETEAWTIRFDGSLPTVRADPNRFQRLFENLFRNSIEHGSEAGTVRVGTLTDGTAGVFVSDDGPGIPAAERDAVFRPGYTVDGGGTGLGLAIVDRIAEAHSWTVSIAESERAGTRTGIRFNAEP